MAQPLRGFHAEEGSLCRAPGGWGGAWRTRELGSGPGFLEHTGGSYSKRETGRRHPSETFGAESSLPVSQACLSLCDPVDCSPPGSSVHGLLQAGILEGVAVSSSRAPSRPRN